MSEKPPSLASLRRQSGYKRRAEPTSPTLSLFDLDGDVSEAPSRTEAVQAGQQLAAGAPVAISEPVQTAPPESSRGSLPQRTTPVREEVPEVPDIPAPPRLWTVSGLLRHVRGLVERDYRRVSVEGEISNWRPSGSGHCYFTIKDNGAQLSAVMFRRQASLLRFAPQDGDAVKLHGDLSIYESRGQIQIIVEWMQQAGLGALLAEVQRLKEQLRREGLFERKRPLPPYPRCIGVITSLQGAALRDIVKVCRRRHASVQLLIYPAAVQGPNCAGEIAAGLRWFNFHTDHAEVVLVARGGGSWEDLHGFDDERVARAIASCSLPVITGIGHATDSTIADAAADVCAPTPSAAAELLTAAQHRIEAHLQALHGRLMRAGHFSLLHARQRFDQLAAGLVLRQVQDRLNRRAQRLDEFHLRAQSALDRRLRSLVNRQNAAQARLARHNPALHIPTARRRLDLVYVQLERSIVQRRLLAERRVDSATTRLHALSPLRVLDRGYALVYGESGHLLLDANDAHPGETIRARLAKGTIQATISDRSPSLPSAVAQES